MQLINVHCHILNFDFVPERLFRVRAPVREWFLRRRATRWLARLVIGLVSPLVPGLGYRRIHELLALMSEDIDAVAARLISEMDDAGIGLAAPLTMDLETSYQQSAEFPYRYQLACTSELAARYPGRLLPFVMVDPRRSDGVEMAVDCLQHHGFLGIKIYPPLGYHPDPASILNTRAVNRRLDRLYRFCAEQEIPITAHCGRVAAYGPTLLKASEKVQESYGRPQAWIPVLRRYEGLRLNIGHFGEDLHRLGESDAWSTAIREMMTEFPQVYADLSYHGEAHKKRLQGQYFARLNGLLDEGSRVSRRILFGTDWPMTRGSWREEEYLAPFREHAGEDRLHQAAFVNAMGFLFAGGVFPARLERFFAQHGEGLADLPGWLRTALHLEIPAAAPAAEPAASSL